ncbi:catalase related subgroup domain-containing protein [Mycena alexandri]|uniref:Catalase related subgroup domain-containing protein n=1 Tax=Mycena alexandri TaxID=1745969 RepID=A0AAD6SCL1_9AGAR|nr:catalase related subgroup domain-containing protein [Mycena alexandri]
MPLPSDQKLTALSEEIIAQFDAIFGLHPGFRPAHARGVMLTGNFEPNSEAAALSKAPHFNQASTPVTVRFSSSTGIPLVPDTDPNANPRGFGLRFNLGDHVHTDIVGHSAPAFPTRTGAEFLEFLRALAGGTIADFLGSHPAALAFVQTPKPFPGSFAREGYYALHAFKFTNNAGATRFGRYTIVPDAGLEHLEEAAVKSKGESYLFDELPTRLAQGPITFHLLCQIANDGDVTDDVTVHWPKDRATVNLGKLTLTGLVPENDREQKKIIFDPIPRVNGIEESDDPLFEFRAALYLISGRRRRAAPDS